MFGLTSMLDLATDSARIVLSHMSMPDETIVDWEELAHHSR